VSRAASICGALLLVAAALGAQQHAVRVEPEACAVGETVRVVCDVPHAAGGSARALSPELDPADPWVFLGAERQDGATSTRLTWSFVGLDPERATPPGVELVLRESAGAETRTVRVEPPSVALSGELGADEDAPRPVLGLRELPAGAVPPDTYATRLALLAGLVAAGLALAVTAFVWRRRALARLGPVDAMPVATRIAILAGSDAPLKARHYELTRLVRLALDERTGAKHHGWRGWTDDELAKALERDEDLRIKLGDRACDAAADVLRRAAPAKYAGVRPTDFAVRETFERAERALAAAEARA
jgi:hypothetical protein